MKKTMAIFTLALAALAGRAALPQPDLIAQIHFAGAEKISADKNSGSFTNEFCSAEALTLRSQVGDKLAPWLAGWLQAKLGVTVPDGAAKLRPLLDDLQTAEWRLEARVATNGKPSVTIAIKLDSPHAQLWRENLKSFPVNFAESRGWLFIGFGNASQELGDILIPAPPSGWLDADVSWPRLAQWRPKLRELGLPETQFTVTATNTEMHIDGIFFFPENPSPNLADWQLPTNLLHEPFDSLTAARGFGSWLKTQKWAQTFQITPAPNQAFIWSVPGMPFQTFLALPVSDSADALKQEFARLQPVFDPTNAADHFFSPLTLSKTDNEITLTGVPFASPFLRAVNGTDGQFLFAGALASSPGRRSLPPDLFQRLAAKNLVFYHWENTAEREPMLLNLSQFGLMLTQHRQLDGDSAAFKWVSQITPSLGNTLTEITQSATDQMTFTRTAPGGFTAFELLALANWIDAPNFPGFDLKLPSRAEIIRQRHPKVSGDTNVPAAPH